MRLIATCDVELEVDEATPLVAMLRPRSDRGQWILSDTYDITPFVRPVEYTDMFGNACQRFVAPAGTLHIRLTCRAEVDEHVPTAPTAPVLDVAALPSHTLQYLLPSRYCPADKLRDLARTIAAGVAPGYAQVAAVAAHVHRRIEYRYGVSTGSSDALDALAVGAGVCRDFSHVCVALCRALDIPARMVVGYLRSLEPQDFHAWFEAYVGDRWYTFDATEDRLLGERIVVARGRDAADVAFISEYGPLRTRSLRVQVTRDV